MTPRYKINLKGLNKLTIMLIDSFLVTGKLRLYERNTALFLQSISVETTLISLGCMLSRNCWLSLF